MGVLDAGVEWIPKPLVRYFGILADVSHTSFQDARQIKDFKMYVFKCVHPKPF